MSEGGNAHVWRSKEMQSELLTLHSRYAWFVVYPLLILALIAACGGRSDGAGDSSSDENIRDTGRAAVEAYVSATATDSAAAEEVYGPLVAPPKTSDGQQQGFPFPGLTVLSASAGTPRLVETRPDKTTIWAVEVHVITDTGMRTYEQRVAETVEPAYRVEGLPGRVPPPRRAPMPDKPLTDQQFAEVRADTPEHSTAHDAYSTVKDFFDAWLAGKGDVKRLADASVPLFEQPPYSEVVLTSVSASKMPNKIDGSITVSATVIATDAAPEELHYTLTLTGASGRWVVTDVTAVPVSK